ncbi:flagellar biosynthesis sigma factor [Trinickia terrae]|uniref:Flagellar biosynthesis sigma factor n=1 Tax=Trinickia terrae TaxID=2571161 RepID=A0A4U1I113_9BURK|nr:flagellar biosynthesis sigma factor [Trinickia terrae]TKC86795.1 flagellar biosynthesis sigma factor [Trinickia terrae]
MQRRKFWRFRYFACAVTSFAALLGICAMALPADEVVLTLGEPYEHVRQQSRSTLPPIGTLPLDKAMAIVLDLQEQLRRRGWHPIRAHRFPPIANTPAMVQSIRRGDDPQTFWQAAGKFQVALDIRRFVHENRPQDERYLLTLELSGPPLMEDVPAD